MKLNRAMRRSFKHKAPDWCRKVDEALASVADGERCETMQGPPVFLAYARERFEREGVPCLARNDVLVAGHFPPEELRSILAMETA